MEYAEFLEAKTHVGSEHGFEPDFMPDTLFDFQKFITEWAIKKGRAAIYADCGLGKTFMQLVWAENVCRKTGGRVLILTPLAVAFQTVKDSTLTDVASADYLLMFRKEGTNQVPVAHEHGLKSYAGELTPPSDILRYRGWTGNQIENRYSQWIWRQYASSVWMDIRLDRVLPYKESREPEDERHVHPLQLDVIERSVVLWSNPGEVVFTPFMGVGSEAYGAVLNGRKAIGAELKKSYYLQAVKNMQSIKEDAYNEDLFSFIEKKPEEITED